MRAHEAVSFSAIAATTAAFTLNGGKYQVGVVGTFGGSGAVGLEQLGPDGATWMASHTVMEANGYAVIEAAPGSFRVAVTDTTALYVKIVRIPGE